MEKRGSAWKFGQVCDLPTFPHLAPPSPQALPSGPDALRLPHSYFSIAARPCRSLRWQSYRQALDKWPMNEQVQRRHSNQGFCLAQCSTTDRKTLRTGRHGELPGCRGGYPSTATANRRAGRREAQPRNRWAVAHARCRTRTSAGPATPGHVFQDGASSSGSGGATVKSRHGIPTEASGQLGRSEIGASTSKPNVDNPTG